MEESAVGIALEGGAEIAEGAEGVAETGGGLGEGTAVDEAGAESFVLALGGVGWFEEVVG